MSNKQYAPAVAAKKIEYIGQVLDKCGISITRTNQLLDAAAEKDPQFAQLMITIKSNRELITAELGLLHKKYNELILGSGTKAGRRSKYFTNLEAGITRLWHAASSYAQAAADLIPTTPAETVMTDALQAKEYLAEKHTV